VIPIVLGGDHTIALPDVTGVARHAGFGRVSVMHFDAHADTGNSQMGSLYGHGTPMRRLIESGACRATLLADRAARLLPEPETLDWMADRVCVLRDVRGRGAWARRRARRSAHARDDRLRRRLPLGGYRRGGPGSARHGHARTGGLTSRQLLDAVRRIAKEVPLAGVDVVEVSPPYDHAEITAYLAIEWSSRPWEASPGAAGANAGADAHPRRSLLKGR